MEIPSIILDTDPEIDEGKAQIAIINWINLKSIRRLFFFFNHKYSPTLNWIHERQFVDMTLSR